MEVTNYSETLVTVYQSTCKIPEYLTIINTAVRSLHIQNCDKLVQQLLLQPIVFVTRHNIYTVF
jgi:hypothetical protein